MVQPLFFEPDPGIPDSDLLGYGDLIYNDGTREFISGDPELASMFPAPDGGSFSSGPAMREIDGPTQGFMPEIGAGDTSNDPIGVDMGGGDRYDLESIPIPGSDATVDISTGEIDVGGGTLPEPRQGSTEIIARDGQMLQPIPGTDASVDISTGQIQPGAAAGMPPMDGGYGTGGMVPVQREGALPPQLAQQQAADRQAMYGQQYQALEQGRQQELAIYRQANAKRMGELQAEEQQLRAQQQEQQAKLQRWQDEQKLTADLDIKTDLTSAVGVMGSILAVVGAALSGYNPEAHTRMLDSVIDQNVRKQINMRDTKLRVLADRIGSTEQAIAHGKAQLYKTIAEKVEMTQKMTQADIFEQQTPQLLADVKAKQLQNEQKEQAISLGRTLEKMPEIGAGPGLTPAQKTKQVEDYGTQAQALARRQKALDNLIGVLKLDIDPKTGTIRNREAILDEGIAGVGQISTVWQSMKARGGMLGAMAASADEFTNTNEGRAVRAALEEIIAPVAREMNGGGQMSEGDIQRARESLGFTSDKGVLDSIERMYRESASLRASNVSKYGAEAAGTYEGRQEQQGFGEKPRQDAQFQRLTEGNAHSALDSYASGQRQGTTKVSDRMGERTAQQAATPEERMAELSDFVVGIAGRELPPEGVEILMAQAGHETTDGSSRGALEGNNMFGLKASERSRSLGYGEANMKTTEGGGADKRKTRDNFVVFDNVGQAVEEHISLLKRKFPEAWEALKEGDPARYVAALRDGSYFTDNETTYLNGILGRLGARQRELDQSMEPGL